MTVYCTYVLQCILVIIIILLQLDLCCWSMLAGRVMMAASFSSVRTVHCPGLQSTTLTRFQTRSHCHTHGMLLSGELIKSVEFIQLPIDCIADNQGGCTWMKPLTNSNNWASMYKWVPPLVCSVSVVYCLSLHGPCNVQYIQHMQGNISFSVVWIVETDGNQLSVAEKY